MTSGESPDEIERQMAALRAAMRREARDVAESARTLADWRYHFRAHPFVFCAAAAALGYLLVPRRASRAIGQVAPEPANGAIETSYDKGVTAGRPLVVAALGLAARYAARQAASYVAHRGQDALRSYVQSRAKREAPAETRGERGEHSID
jgi:hypothetical protein